MAEAPSPVLAAENEYPVSELYEVAPKPEPASFPPYPPYAVEPVPPSLADAIIAGRDLRIKQKATTPRKVVRAPPKPARPRGPKATDVKLSNRAARAHARCLRRHNVVLTDRLERISKPQKRTIIYLWREFANLLPADTIARLRTMLDADEPFKPDQAYEYFINMRKTKKRSNALRINEIKKDVLAMCADKRFAWARNATVAFARGIQQRLTRPGRYVLADGMLRLSNIVMDEICGYMHIKTPSRCCTHPKAKFMMEMSDKVAIWIDQILSESDDRMLMMDFDEDDDVMNADEMHDSGFTDDFLNMMGGGHLLKKPDSAHLNFTVEATRGQNAALYFGQKLTIAIQHGNVASILGTLPTGDMAEAFEILTNAMDKNGNKPLISYGKCNITYKEAADELMKATDFDATQFNSSLAQKVQGDLLQIAKPQTPPQLLPNMKEVVNICGNYLAQLAEYNVDKSPAFKLLVKQMRAKGNAPLYKSGKATRTYTTAAKELEDAKGLETDHDEPNLSQEIHKALSGTVASVTPKEMKNDMEDALDISSKYLSQCAVDEKERGPAFDLLIKELEAEGAGDFAAEFPVVATKAAAAYTLRSAPGLSSVTPNPKTVGLFAKQLHAAADAATPNNLKSDMNDTINGCANYLSGFVDDREKAQKLLLEMMAANGAKNLIKRNAHSMSYGDAAAEIQTAPTLIPFLPVKDIADEIKSKLTADMEGKIPTELKNSMKCLINDASKHLSEPVALRSGAAGDRYPLDLLSSVEKTLGSRILFQHKGYGLTHSDAANELKYTGPLDTNMEPKHDVLRAEIQTEMGRGVGTRLSPGFISGLHDTMGEASKHLAKIGYKKGEAMHHLLGLMKEQGDAPLGVMQGYQQSYNDGARRLTVTSSLANEKVDKGAYESVRSKLTTLANSQPNPDHEEHMPGVIEESSKFLAKPGPETEAEKRQVLADLMARKGDEIIDQDGLYKLTYTEAGREHLKAPVGVATSGDPVKQQALQDKANDVIPDKKMKDMLKGAVQDGSAYLADMVKGRGEAMQVIHDDLKKEGNKEFLNVGNFKKNHAEVADMLTKADHFGGEQPSSLGALYDKASENIAALPKAGASDTAKKHMDDAIDKTAAFVANVAGKESGLDKKTLAEWDGKGQISPSVAGEGRANLGGAGGVEGSGGAAGVGGAGGGSGERKSAGRVSAAGVGGASASANAGVAAGGASAGAGGRGVGSVGGGGAGTGSAGASIPGAKVGGVDSGGLGAGAVVGGTTAGGLGGAATGLGGAGSGGAGGVGAGGVGAGSIVAGAGSIGTAADGIGAGAGGVSAGVGSIGMGAGGLGTGAGVTGVGVGGVGAGRENTGRPISARGTGSVGPGGAGSTDMGAGSLMARSAVGLRSMDASAASARGGRAGVGDARMTKATRALSGDGLTHSRISTTSGIDEGELDPDRKAALSILHRELRAKGNQTLYKQPHTELSYAHASTWISQKPRMKVDKMVKESADTARLHKKFERKLGSLVSTATPPAMQDTMQDVVIESSRILSEYFVSNNYKALVADVLISEMQKKGNEILVDVGGSAETFFFAAQRLKKTNTLDAKEPCDEVAYFVSKKLDDMIRGRSMARKLTSTMKEHVKDAADYLSEHVTKPDEYIEAYVALLGEMEATGDALLIEGDIPKSYKNAAAYLRQLTHLDDRINRPNPGLQSSTEAKLNNIMAHVPQHGYTKSVLDGVIRDVARHLVSYIMLQGVKTEALKILIGKLDEAGQLVLLRHGTLKKTYVDGADMLRGKNTDELSVVAADPVVSRKIQIKLLNLMRTRTPDNYKAIMEDVIEDTTMFLAVQLLQPRVIKVCKCMNNVFVQCELWCEEILRHVARPSCTCSRHMPATSSADLAPSCGHISLTQCRSLDPCPAPHPTPSCHALPAYMVYSCRRTYPSPPITLSRSLTDPMTSSSTSPPETDHTYGQRCSPIRFSAPSPMISEELPSLDLADTYMEYPTCEQQQACVTSAARPEHPSEIYMKPPMSVPSSSGLKSLLHDVYGDKVHVQRRFVADSDSDRQILTVTAGTRPNSFGADYPSRTSSAMVGQLTACSLPPQLMFPGSSTLPHSHSVSSSSAYVTNPSKTTTRTRSSTSRVSNRTLVISTDQMSDWHAMMVSLMWNVQAWRDWIQENIDRALKYQRDPNESKAEADKSWAIFQRRVATEALQWRQYNNFSRQLTLRLALRYRDKHIVSPTRATDKTEIYMDCQEEMLQIIDMFNRWTQWLTAVVKETNCLTRAAANEVPLHELRWLSFKKKVEECAEDWSKYNTHLKMCWEEKYRMLITDWLPAWKQLGPVWVVSACGAVPGGAVPAGLYDSEVVWLARTTHRCSVLPAALHPSKHCCIVYADGGVHHYTKYQVMCNAEVRWAPWRAGGAGPRAVRVARGVLAGRVLHRGRHLLGAVLAPHYRCHVVIFGRPVAFNCYEMLVLAGDD